ncbi:MAG: PQQ-binding-like beta-propeller repeat protein [Verrucomicrobiota bacterium]
MLVDAGEAFMASSKVIYLGIKGSVVALDSASGAQLWTGHLAGSDFVNVVLDGDNLYATTHGKIFCLDPTNGAGRWSNPLKGMGYGLCSIASESVTPTSLLNIVAEVNRQRAAATQAAKASQQTG